METNRLTQLRRKWNWLGHILERNDDSIAKQALLGNSMATEIDDRIRGKRDVEKEMWTAGFRYSWRWQHKTELDGDK